MLILDSKTIIIRDSVSQITPLVEFMSDMGRDTDVSNTLVDPEPDYRIVIYSSYRVGAIVKLKCGTEHKIYNIVETSELDNIKQEELIHDAEQYAVDISKLIYPNKTIKFLKIGK